jgi:Zn ribbon nucleic-acid-binding protein
MNFKTSNHEKHYILWDEIVKKLQYFKDVGVSHLHEESIDLMKADICENHPNLGSPSHCYACNEADRIQLEKKTHSADECVYCPINWGYDIGAEIDDCGDPESIHRRLREKRYIDDSAIKLAIKIRDAEWRI